MSRMRSAVALLREVMFAISDRREASGLESERKMRHAFCTALIGDVRAGMGAPHTVPTGVAGEPTAPGRRNGGAVNKKRLRPCARNQFASSVRYQISPRFTPSLNRQCSCKGN